MIGNDVIDLQLASRQSNWRRKGFLEKVFLEDEQEYITGSHNPNLVVWLLWSMKEAAYKANQRELNLPRRLNWLAQECRIINVSSEKASGTVKITERIYHTTSEITSEYIHTSAERIPAWGVKNAIFETSSSEVKQEVIRLVSEKFQIKEKEIRLEKDAFGMPFLSSNNSFFFNRFSLSGHGKFYAYSLSLINCETSVKQS
ncbi:4'-phosphopantetheinyl transferase family protein [Salinimicrobium sp. CAU 1759]